MPEIANKQFDVAIVGAGPVGLSLALFLVRRGHDVLVLEKNADVSDRSRAPAIWPRTQEILKELGVIDRFLAEGILLQKLELWDADRERILLSAPIENLSDVTSFPHLLVLPQSRTERFLRDALQEYPNAYIRFSSEVTDAQNENPHVRIVFNSEYGESSIQSRFAVGCDGARSLVREKIGASLEGLTYKLEAALVDVSIPNSSDLRFPRISTKNVFAVGIRMGESLWRLILPFAGKDSLPLEARAKAAMEQLFDAPFTTEWQSTFRLHRRVSTAFAKGRIYLAGDAAHLNSPVGGQGMNAGIQDAQALGNALDRALKSNDSSELDHYATERPKATRSGVNRFTDTLTRILLVRNGKLVRPSLRIANLALRIPSIQRRILLRLAMLKG